MEETKFKKYFIKINISELFYVYEKVENSAMIIVLSKIE